VEREREEEEKEKGIKFRKCLNRISDLEFEFYFLEPYNWEAE
jgi:hypothetical protein